MVKAWADDEGFHRWDLQSHPLSWWWRHNHCDLQSHLLSWWWRLELMMKASIAVTYSHTPLADCGGTITVTCSHTSLADGEGLSWWWRLPSLSPTVTHPLADCGGTITVTYSHTSLADGEGLSWWWRLPSLSPTVTHPLADGEGFHHHWDLHTEIHSHYYKHKGTICCFIFNITTPTVSGSLYKQPVVSQRRQCRKGQWGCTAHKQHWKPSLSVNNLKHLPCLFIDECGGHRLLDCRIWKKTTALFSYIKQ